MRKFRRMICALLAFAALAAACLPNTAFAAGSAGIDDAIGDTAQYIMREVTDPTVGSTGGEWSIIGLARSCEAVPQSYYDTYYKNLEAYVKERNGVLHERKYTEYSRVILALTAIGRDPRDVAGYDLVEPLGDFDKTVYQGINGAIFALIALDSGGYAVPKNGSAETQATRGMYVDFILGREEAEGGWSLSRGHGCDTDVTGMAIQVLSKYTGREDVRAAVDRALARLSEVQNGDGSFSSSASFGGGEPTCESTVQVLVALTELGVSLNDSRFVKNGRTVLGALLSFYSPGEGFIHVGDGSGVGGMATEQGLYALAAARRAEDGMNSLYDMTAERRAVSFADLSESDWFRADVMFVAERNLFGGVENRKFDPKADMTRETLAAALYRMEGEPETDGSSRFEDVEKGSWYADAVAWASENGIVNGVSNTLFGVGREITREQIAAMLMRYAAYRGCDISARADLGAYSDAGKISAYAKDAMAWANAEGLITGKTSSTLDPSGHALRCEVAAMIRRFYDMEFER